MRRWIVTAGLCLAAPLLGCLPPGRADPSPPQRVEWSHSACGAVGGTDACGPTDTDGVLVSALVVDGRPVVIRCSPAL